MSAEANLRTARLAGHANEVPPAGETLNSSAQMNPGVGAARSSIEQSPEAHEEDGADIRFCALLDYVLPECVVQYLEQFCMAVYNCLTSLCSQGQQPEEVEQVTRKRRYQEIVDGEDVQPDEQSPALYIQTVITQRAGKYFYTTSGGKYQFVDPRLLEGEWSNNHQITVQEDLVTSDDGSYFSQNLTTGQMTRIVPVAQIT